MDSSFHGDTTFAMNGMDGGGANPTFLPPKAEEARTSHKRTRAQMASGSTVPKVEKKVRRAASHIEHSCNNCAADLLDRYRCVALKRGGRTCCLPEKYAVTWGN